MVYFFRFFAIKYTFIMKNFLRKASFISLATLLLIIASQFSVLADTNPAAQTNELNIAEVISYFALLLLAILVPVFKKSNRATNLR